MWRLYPGEYYERLKHSDGNHSYKNHMWCEVEFSINFIEKQK